MIFKFTLKNIQVNNHVTTFVFNNDNNNNSEQAFRSIKCLFTALRVSHRPGNTCMPRREMFAFLYP